MDQAKRTGEKEGRIWKKKGEMYKHLPSYLLPPLILQQITELVAAGRAGGNKKFPFGYDKFPLEQTLFFGEKFKRLPMDQGDFSRLLQTESECRLGVTCQSLTQPGELD